MHVRCDNQYKTEADRGNILGQPMPFECMGICFLSPAHDSEMRGYRVYVLIVKYLSHWFCLNSATVNYIGRPYRGILEGFLKTFLEGSLDHIRDYIVHRRSFIYCSLATVKSLTLTSFYWVLSAVMELWQKSFLLEENYDELEMAYYMVCHQLKRPVYHGWFSMDDFCESDFFANFTFATKKKKKEERKKGEKKDKQTKPFTWSSIKLKNKTFNKIYRIRAWACKISQFEDREKDKTLKRLRNNSHPLPSAQNYTWLCKCKIVLKVASRPCNT